MRQFLNECENKVQKYYASYDLVREHQSLAKLLNAFNSSFFSDDEK
jgi:hypothetical protein